MATKRSDEHFLSRLLKDPEAERQFAELLEGFARIADSTGSQAVVDALSRSFAIMGNAQSRADYDELRREVVRYLQSRDASGGQSTASEPVEFRTSPELTEEQVHGVAAAILEAGVKPEKLD